jgi:hypothetical protein
LTRGSTEVSKKNNKKVDKVLKLNHTYCMKDTIKIDKKFSYTYPRSAVTIDCVVFGLDNFDLKVLLIQGKLDPFSGK